MKGLLVVLACVALATSLPLGPNVNQWGQVVGVTPAQVSSQRIAQQLQQAQLGVLGQLWGIKSNIVPSSVAQVTAQNVVQQALEARQGQTVEGIQQLQQNLAQQGGVFGNIPQFSIRQAINRLQSRLQYQQQIAPLVVANSQLGNTLEAIIQAQLISNNVGTPQAGQSIDVVGENSQVFQSKIQQLVDISNIKEIQIEISRQYVVVEQLIAQLNLVQEQIQQINAQLISVQNQGVTGVSQLQQSIQQLLFQEQQLVLEKMSRQFVIQQLQLALVEQQNQLQNDIVSGPTGLDWTQWGNSWSVNPQFVGQSQVPQSNLGRWWFRNGNTGLGKTWSGNTVGVWPEGNWIV